MAKAFGDAGDILIPGCKITEVKEDEPLEIESARGKLHGRSLIYATHLPPGVYLLHFRCAPYSSYAMAIKLKAGEYPEGLAHDMYDPYHYYRTQEIGGETYLVAGKKIIKPHTNKIHGHGFQNSKAACVNILT